MQAREELVPIQHSNSTCLLTALGKPCSHVGRMTLGGEGSVIKTLLQALNLCLPGQFTSPLSLYKHFLSLYSLPLFCAFNSFQIIVQ